MRIENWNGHSIRFVEKEPGEWWAVAKDIAIALGYRDSHEISKMIDRTDLSKSVVNMNPHKVSTSDESNISSPNRKVLIISEIGIYEAIFSSQKPEAKEFKAWVKQVIKTLRQASGLEGFQIFRMLNKEHQKDAMRLLQEGLRQPVKIDYIKANTIANKAVSNLYGLAKMMKKDDMPPDMLTKRQSILDDTVELMTVNEKYGLKLSISESIYARNYAGKERQE